jgi:hypothetical protein
MDASGKATTDLYDRKIEGPFSALCGGGQDNDGNMEDCIEIAPLVGGGYAVGDTKLQGDSPQLRFSEAELTKFARGWLAKNDDAPNATA